MFVRYLTGDEPHPAPNVRSLLEWADRGAVQLIATALPIAAIVRVLESVYELNRPSLRAKVLAILGVSGLDVEGQAARLQAVTWYVEKDLDVADAYSAAWMRCNGTRSIEILSVLSRSRHDGRRNYERIDRGSRLRSTSSRAASTRMVSTAAGTVPSRMRPRLARRIPVRMG